MQLSAECNFKFFKCKPFFPVIICFLLLFKQTIVKYITEIVKKVIKFSRELYKLEE